MAKTWIVTPNDGVTAATDGVYVFPANDTYDDKVYTVTLKDTDCNCVAHKTIKVKGKSAPTACTCSITSDYGTTSSKISSDQHANVKIGTFTTYECTGTTTFSYSSGDADFVSNFAYVGNDIYADVGQNESTTNDRMAIYNASCGGSLTIYQANGEEPVPDCPTDYLIGLAAGTVSAIGGGYDLARFKNNITDYTTALTVSMSDGSSATIADSGTSYAYDSSYNVIKVNVPQNTSTNSRTISVTCTLTHTGGTTCTDTKTFTQEGAASCSCSDLTVNGTEVTGMSVTIKVSHSGNVKYISEYSLEFTDGSSYGDLIQCESVQDETIILDTPSIPSTASSLTISRAVLVVSDQPNCSGSGTVTASLSTTTITNGSTVTLTI